MACGCRRRRRRRRQSTSTVKITVMLSSTATDAREILMLPQTSTTRHSVAVIFHICEKIIKYFSAGAPRSGDERTVGAANATRNGTACFRFWSHFAAVVRLCHNYLLYGRHNSLFSILI